MIKQIHTYLKFFCWSSVIAWSCYFFLNVKKFLIFFQNFWKDSCMKFVLNLKRNDIYKQVRIVPSKQESWAFCITLYPLQLAMLDIPDILCLAFISWPPVGSLALNTRRRFKRVVDVYTTLYQCQNDVACLHGGCRYWCFW